jgi:hypothetical protein
MVIAESHGGVGSSLTGKTRYLPENRMLSQVCLEMAVEVGLPPGSLITFLFRWIYRLEFKQKIK